MKWLNGSQATGRKTEGVDKWLDSFIRQFLCQWHLTMGVYVEKLSAVTQLHVVVSASSREAHTAIYRCTCRAKNGMNIFSIFPFDVLPLSFLSLLPSLSLTLPF